MREFEVETEYKAQRGGRLWVAFLCVFTDAVCFTFIFAFLPFYVESLLNLDGLEKHQRDAKVAYHCGILGTSYSAGQVISAFAIGSLSDKIGRRPVLIAGTAATVVINVVFPLAPTFVWAVFIRFMVKTTQNGLCNAVIVAARAMLSDYTEDKERVSAFVRLNKYGLVGVILGPCIGGSLSEPNKHLPDVFHSAVFDSFPFLLPCLFCCLLSLVTFLVVLAYARDKPRVADPLLPRPPSRTESFSILRSNPQFRLACLCWSLNGFTGAMFVELLGLWCKTDSTSGGLGWSQEAKLSVVFFCGSASLFLFMATGLRKVIAGTSTGTVLRFGLILGATSMGIVPRISDFPSAMVWPSLLICNIVFSTSMGASVTSINIIINTVVPRELYGAANGLGISLVAFVRAFGPITGGMIFGWSISEQRSFPLDRSSAFLIAGAVNLITFALARKSLLP